MTDGPLELRVFGLDFAVNVQPERRDAVARQWHWCRPDAPSQRTIAPLPSAPHRVGRGGSSVGSETAAGLRAAGTAEVERVDIAKAITVDRIDDAPGSGSDTGDYTLTTTLTGRAISARAGEFVMLHAGGVCDPDTGVVAGLFAASGTGKTTATQHYCTHGYGYVTDETLIFNDRRDVMAYPKPLSVLVNPGVSGVKTQHCPDDLDMAPPRDGALRLGPLVLLDRIRDDARPDESVNGGDAEADATRAAPDRIDAEDDNSAGTHEPGEAELSEMPLFEALTLILPQSSAMPQIDGCLDLLARIALAGGGVQRLRYREIADTLPLLRDVFTLAPQEPFWRHVPGTWWTQQPDVDPYVPLASATLDADVTAGDGDDDRAFATREDPVASPADSAEALTNDTVLTLAPFVDALVDEDALEVLTLIGSTPAHLHGLGAVIHLTLLDGPRSLADLVDVCTATLGEHPDANALVRRAAHDLLTNRVVRVIR